MHKRYNIKNVKESKKYGLRAESTGGKIKLTVSDIDALKEASEKEVSVPLGDVNTAMYAYRALAGVGSLAIAFMFIDLLVRGV